MTTIAHLAKMLIGTFGHDDVAKAGVDSWLRSPNHLKNIVGDYRYTGVGVVKTEKGEYYYTQIFWK